MKRFKNVITPERITQKFCEQVILDTIKGKRKRFEAVVLESKLEEYAKTLRGMVLELPVPEDILISNENPLREYFPDAKIIKPIELHPYKFSERMDRGKLRKLCKPELWPDQCIHHVLIKSLEKQFIKRMDPLAAASIPGRGQTYILHSLSEYLRTRSEKKTTWTLKLDIKKCFDSLRSEVVWREIQKIVKDKRWLEIFNQVIFMHPTLPIGLYISAWVLNLVLKPIDDAIRANRATDYYCRYMDDMVIIGPNKKALKWLLENIIRPKLAELGLEVKSNWRIFKTDDQNDNHREGIDVVGFRFYKDKIIMRKRNFNHLRHACLRVMRLFDLNQPIPKKLSQSMVSMAGPKGFIFNYTINKYLFKARFELVKNNISIRDSTNARIHAIKMKSWFYVNLHGKDYPIYLSRQRLSSRRRYAFNKERNRIGRLRHRNRLFNNTTTYMERERLRMKITPWKYFVSLDLMDLMFCRKTKQCDSFAWWWYYANKEGGEFYNQPFYTDDSHIKRDLNEVSRKLQEERDSMTKEEKEAYHKYWYTVSHKRIRRNRHKLLKSLKVDLDDPKFNKYVRYKDGETLYPDSSLTFR